MIWWIIRNGGFCETKKNCEKYNGSEWRWPDLVNKYMHGNENVDLNINEKAIRKDELISLDCSDHIWK